MKDFITRIHCGLAYLTFAAVVAQFFLAGLGAFGVSGYAAHMLVGSFVGLSALLLLTLALAGRLGGATLRLSAALFALTLLQYALPRGPAVVAALHPLNAVPILFVAQRLALRTVGAGDHDRAAPRTSISQ